MSKQSQESTASAPVNVLLMLREHCAPRHRELHGELARLRTREQSIRDEISRIERHAAIEGIELAPESKGEPASPIVVEPKPQEAAA